MLLKIILYLGFSLSPYSAAHMVAPQILLKMETFLGGAHLSFLCCGTVET